MSIIFQCPKCGAAGRVEHLKAGAQVACPSCRHAVTIPPLPAPTYPDVRPPDVPSSGVAPRAGNSSLAKAPPPPLPMPQPRRSRWWLITFGSVFILSGVLLVVFITLTPFRQKAPDTFTMAGESVGPPPNTHGLRFHARDLNATQHWANALSRELDERKSYVIDLNGNTLRQQKREKQYSLELVEVEKRDHPINA